MRMRGFLGDYQSIGPANYRQNRSEYDQSGATGGYGSPTLYDIWLDEGDPKIEQAFISGSRSWGPNGKPQVEMSFTGEQARQRGFPVASASQEAAAEQLRGKSFFDLSDSERQTLGNLLSAINSVIWRGLDRGTLNRLSVESSDYAAWIGAQSSAAGAYALELLQAGTSPDSVYDKVATAIRGAWGRDPTTQESNSILATITNYTKDLSYAPVTRPVVVETEAQAQAAAQIVPKELIYYSKEGTSAPAFASPAASAPSPVSVLRTGGGGGSSDVSVPGTPASAASATGKKSAFPWLALIGAALALKG